MSSAPAHDLDVAILGGGIAGLWLLDELASRGCRAVLLETAALGTGQTIGSQGIIHGGLKYMLAGTITPPAKAISEMPEVWRRCLAGQRQPDLSAVTVRSDGCWIWGTGSIKSRIFLLGSNIALRAKPVEVERAGWPPALAAARGKVLKVPEPVLDTSSLMRAFSDRNTGRVLWVDREPEFAKEDGVWRVAVSSPDGSHAAVLRPRLLVLAAGEGNAGLRERLGLPAGAMQTRPLHMVMARGRNLPPLFGHCVDGTTPRVTITSATDSAGRTVWQVGGQIAEDGVPMDRDAYVAHARRELLACVPGLDLSGVGLASYRVNRAEAATASGQRPDDAQVAREGDVVTVWPTKLAFAPRATERVIELISPASGVAPWQTGPAPAGRQPILPDWPRPPVALPPWERETQWT